MSAGSQLDDIQGNQGHLLMALSQGGTPFGMLPLFSRDDEARRRKHSLSYEQDVSLNDEQLMFKWQVSADPIYGFPDAFDRKIFKIIESLALQQEQPLKNPIHFSLYHFLLSLNMT